MVLPLILIFAASVTASAQSYPPSGLVLPGITGSTFLYGNSGVNAVGQTSYVTPANGGWGYRYFVPVNYNSSNKYPVIIFLHGLGEKGTNDTSQMTAGGNTANGALGLVASYNPVSGLNNQTTYPCFLVLPQYPNGADWTAADGADTVLNNIISTLNTYYSIDKDRICLTGLSEGGFGTWNLPSTTMQTVFSCVVPLSSGPATIMTFPDSLPVWAFHAADDTTVAVGGSDSGISNLRGRGLKELYTRYNTGGHSTQTWGSAYLTPGLLPWIFSQRRGQSAQGVIGTAPNVLITGTTQGTTFSMNAVAPSDATRVGWVKSTVGNGNSGSDGAASGTNFSSASQTFTSGTVGYRVGITNSAHYQTYYNIVADVDSHNVTLATTPVTTGTGLGFTLFPLGNYLNPSPGTLASGIWSMTGLTLSNAQFQLIHAMAELPSYNTNNGGYTTVNQSYPLAYVTPSGDTTPPTISISSPSLTNGGYATNGSLTISGTASDTGGSGLSSVTWTSSIGYSGTASGTTSWSISSVPLVYGDNLITIIAKDGQNNTSTASVDVTYTGTSANQSPIVDAGPYQSITWPTSSVTLAGAVSDDGLPSGSSVTTTWSKVSGPGTVTFSNSHALNSTATFSQPGTYVLQLLASDTALSSVSDIAISVLPPTTETVVEAVDCGSTSSYTATDGIVYSADIISTGTTGLTNAGISGTTDDALYQKYRAANSGSGGTFTYTFSGLSAGTYDVVLKFIESAQSPQIVGMRTFNISAQGTQVVSALDVYARVGAFYAYEHVLPGVTVTGAGTLTLTFNSIIGYPSISGILVRSSSAPTFTDGPPPTTATVGTSYSFTYTATGTPAPTFTLASGALPSGLTLTLGGVLSGTPTTAGVYTGTVNASNTSGTASQNFTITVNQVTAFTDGPPPGGIVGTAYSFTYTASGYPAPTFTVISGTLPSGLTLTSGGVLSGTPSTAGTYSGTVSANNGIGSAPTQNFSITISPARSPYFSQDFSSSSTVSDYFSSSPTSSQFDDISAETDGGTWSISSGMLQLVRTGTGGSNNGAGFTRLNSGTSSSIADVHFTVSLSGVTFFGVISSFDLGNITSVTDYNNSTATVNLGNSLLLNANGTGSFNFKVGAGSTTYGSYSANGTSVSVEWLVNQSASSTTYNAPDGSGTHTLSAQSSSLWVNNVALFENVASGYTCSRVDGFRHHTSTAHPVTFQFDNFNVYNSMP